jgi:allophanate hydrolase subunit 1
MIKKLFSIVILVAISSHFLKAQVTDSIPKKLIPLDSLLSRIKADTSTIAIPDSMKVDTVYIDNPLNVIKVGVDFASSYGFSSISYERVIHFMGSIQLKVEFLGKYNPLGGVGYIKDSYVFLNKISGIGLTPEFRYYGTENYAPKGLFAGVYLPFKIGTAEVAKTQSLNGVEYTIANTSLNYTQIGLGFDVGYQYLYKKRMTIEGLIGVAISKGTFSGGEYSVIESYNGVEIETKLAIKDGFVGNAFYPRAEINVGWAF